MQSEKTTPNTSMIRVSQDTRDRLYKFKKGHSYDSMLIAFLNYFETLKIRPEHENITSVSILKNEIERVIKIIKAQEKEIFKPAFELLKKSNQTKSIEQFSREKNLDEELTVQDFEMLVEQLTQKEKNIAELTDKMNELQNKLLVLDEKNIKLKGFTGSINKNLIKECCNKIASLLNSLEGSNDIEGYLNRILDELKD